MNLTLLKKYETLEISKVSEKDQKTLEQVKKLLNNFEETNEAKNKVGEQILDQVIKLNPDAVKKPQVVAQKVAKVKQVAKAKKVTQAKKPATTSTAKTSGNNIMSVAKEIQKAGESWKDAMERAKTVLKERRGQVAEQKKTELEKLLALVRTKKELQGFANSDIKRDAVREAKVKGARFVTKEGSTSNAYGTFPNKLGRKYWETRDRHSDRLAPNYPKDMPLLAKGGNVSNEEKLLKELHKLQRDLNSSRLSTYREGDDSQEEKDRTRERESKLARFNEILKVLRESDAKFANGGSLPFMTDPNFGNFQNTGSFADGGDLDKYKLELYDMDYAFISSPKLSELKKEFANEIKNKGYKVFDLPTSHPDYKRGNKWGLFKPKSFELGGAFMTTDLAGHSGGGTGGLNADMPLSGVSGTNYTGLVGETGAMSSGELFMDGGAMAQNQQVINDASQSYVNYYLGEGASQGIYKDGGSIPNNYEGRTPEDVWNNWDLSQKLHFLSDHTEEVYGKASVKGETNNEINEFFGKLIYEKYDDLPINIKVALVMHTTRGQYASGGALKDVDDNLYVSISKTEDDYWFITSKPTTKKQAEEMANLVTPMRGEVNDVKTVGQVKAHSKVIYENGGAFAPSVSNGTEFMSGVYANGGSMSEDISECKKLVSAFCKEFGDKFGLNEEAILEKVKFRDYLGNGASVFVSLSVTSNVEDLKVGETRPTGGYIIFTSDINPNGVTGKDDIARTYSIDIEIKGVKRYTQRRTEEGRYFKSYNYGRTIEEAMDKTDTKIIYDLYSLEKKDDLKFKMSSLFADGGAFAPSISNGTQFMNGVYANGGSVNDSVIDELWNGYASAVLFTETDSDSGEPLDSEYSVSDFDKETVTSTKKMLADYYSENKDAIEESGLDLDTIGNDIWYTRSRQGVGFFDHSLDEEVEEKLTKGAEALGEYPSVETYDGKISVRGGKVFAKGGKIKVGGDDFTFLLDLSDKELQERLELVNKQKTINAKKYFEAKDKKENTSKIEEAGTRLDNQWYAIVEARSIKNFAKGGFVGTVEFNVGDTVWQKDEKRYATVMNNYGDPINGDYGELRLDTTGNTLIFTSDKEYNTTGYNLIKLGEKGDTGKFTPEVLEDMKASANRLIESRRQGKDKEGVAYYQEVYKRLLDGEFDSMAGGAKATASNKKSSVDYTYVPNKDVKELSVVVKGELKKLMGSDILDGVYVKNSAKSTAKSTAKVDANAVFAKMLKDAKEAKIGKTKRFTVTDLKKLNLEMVQKLVEAGYTEQQIRNIIFGYAFDNEIVADNELEYDKGIFSYEDTYVKSKIEGLVEAQKNKEFAVGIEYPDFDWQGIIKKYKISSKPKDITEKQKGTSGSTENYYEVFVGENIVIGHNYGYKWLDADGKVLSNYMEEDKKVSDPTKQNAWQKERGQKAGFNGGWWTIISSKIEIIDDVLKTLLAQKGSYCKEIQFYDDSLPKALKENKIDFELGGDFAPNVSDGTQFMGDVYAKGGKLTKYIDHDDIKSVTLKLKGKVVTVAGSDVLNGANILKDGGDLSKIANYVGKNDVVSVELKNGETIKPANGYWVKKGAEPLSAPSSKPVSKTGARFKFEVGDKVMVDDSGYVTSFTEFDLSKPAEIIDRSVSKMGGKTYYFYKLKMADGRTAFNQAEQSKLTLAQNTTPTSKKDVNKLVAPKGYVFVNSGSHRATQQINRSDVKYISLYSFGGSNTSAGTTIMFMTENDYEKIKGVRGVSPAKSYLSAKSQWFSRQEDKKLDTLFREIEQKESFGYADGGSTDEVAKIKVSSPDGKYVDTWYITKDTDTTHFYISNSTESKGVPYHVGQFRSEVFYEDLRSWLKGGTNIDGKEYKTNSYAKGGEMQGNNIDAELQDFDLDNLDPIETMQYNHFVKSSGKVGALQVLINSVEGDYSQLSPELAELAEMQLSTEEWDEMTNEQIREEYSYAKGGDVEERLVGSFYYDSRKDKTFRIIYSDKDKISIQYFDKSKNPVGKIEDVQRSEFEYLTNMGAWGKYKQSYFADGGFMNNVYAKGGDLKGKFLAEIGVPYNFEYVVEDEYEFSRFLSKALTNKFNFGNGAWGIKIVKPLFEKNYGQKIVVEIDIPLGVTQGGGLDKFDVLEFMSKTLTKKWFGNGVWSVEVVNSYADGAMLDDNEGFMKADNENNYRYPEREVHVDTLDEPIDLTNKVSRISGKIDTLDEPIDLKSNVSRRTNDVVIRTLDESADLNDDKRVRARMSYNPKDRNPDKLLSVNPRAFEFIKDLPMPTSNTHKND